MPDIALIELAMKPEGSTKSIALVIFEEFTKSFLTLVGGAIPPSPAVDGRVCQLQNGSSSNMWEYCALQVHHEKLAFGVVKGVVRKRLCYFTRMQFFQFLPYFRRWPRPVVFVSLRIDLSQTNSDITQTKLVAKVGLSPNVQSHDWNIGSFGKK